MKRIHTAASLPEAYLVRDLLESKSLVVEIRGESLGGLHGEIPVPDTMPSVWVPEESEAAARSALAEFEAESARVASEANWRCARCGEESEAGFGVCWSCGTERP